MKSMVTAEPFVTGMWNLFMISEYGRAFREIEGFFFYTLFMQRIYLKIFKNGKKQGIMNPYVTEILYREGRKL